VEQAKILVVDDTPQNLELLSQILEKQNYQLYCASNSTIALTVAQSGWADLILLNVKMLEIDSYEICQKLKTHPQTQNIPLIFLITLDDITERAKVFQAGGMDYIIKPFYTEEVLLKVNYQLTIKETQKTINLLNEQLEDNVKARTIKLEIAHQKLQAEIQQRQQAQEKLFKLALHDPVTGLPNRNSFLSKLKQLLVRYQNQSEYHFAVFLINCHQLSEIKCHFDHLEINKLLITVANRLQSCLPRSATLSRFEGNSFAIILEQITEGEKELIQWVEILQKQFNQTFDLTSTTSEYPEKQQELIIFCNIGIVIGADRYSAAYEILQNAEIAVYLAQKEERNYYFFTKESLREKTIYHKITDNSLSNLTVTSQKLKFHFQEAIKREKICLYYQPIIDLQTAKNFEVKGIEILNNQQDNYRKLFVLTNLFQDIEETQLSSYLSNFILDFACFQIKELQQQHETQQNFFVTMQVAENFFLQPQLVLQIKQILITTNLAAKYLHLDLMGNDSTLANQEILTVLQELYQLGIKINLDCNTLSYESIKNVSNFHFNSFKLDKSLTSQITNQNNQQNILGLIAKIINLAHTNKIKVTAKGIDTEEQLTYLQSVGCDYGQGNLFSKPLDKSTLETFLVWRL
jgi:diguanylate cyclase (GGDEF)-like protein